MNSESLVTELAELADLPRYKVARMFTHLVRVIKYETGRGSGVTLPLLGEFKARRVKAKATKNAIAGRGNDGLLRETVNTPARRKLVFIPKDSEKWL